MAAVMAAVPQSAQPPPPPPDIEAPPLPPEPPGDIPGTLGQSAPVVETAYSPVQQAYANYQPAAGGWGNVSYGWAGQYQHPNQYQTNAQAPVAYQQYAPVHYTTWNAYQQYPQGPYHVAQPAAQYSPYASAAAPYPAPAVPASAAQVAPSAPAAQVLASAKPQSGPIRMEIPNMVNRGRTGSGQQAAGAFAFSAPSAQPAHWAGPAPALAQAQPVASPVPTAAPQAVPSAGILSIPSLQAWLKRAFTALHHVEGGPDRVKAVVNSHKAAGTIHTHDWDREPIPTTYAQPHPSTTGARESLEGSRLAAPWPTRARSPRWGPPATSASSSPDFRGRGRSRSRSRSRSPPFPSSPKRDLRMGRKVSTPRRGRRNRERYSPALPPSPDGRESPVSLLSSERPSRRAQRGGKARRGKKGRGEAPVRADTAAARGRAARFASQAPDAALAQVGAATPDEELAPPKEPIVGTCERLEKEFLRLNVMPRPEDVRPEGVVAAALARLVGLLAERKVDYAAAWSQLKAMRQDLTVQAVRSAVTVQVEEAFARAALEYGDFREFNKCAVGLDYLYRAPALEGARGEAAEFVAYRILATTCQAQATADMALRALRTARALGLTPAPAVRHALAARRAFVARNGAAFWRLYAAAPRLSRVIMDRGTRALRWASVRSLVAAHKAAPAGLCADVLGFAVGESPAPEPVHAPLPGCRERVHAGCTGVRVGEGARFALCRACLLEHGAVLRSAEGAPGWELDACKIKPEAIVMPEEKDKADHGDVQVNIEQFLKAGRL